MLYIQCKFDGICMHSLLYVRQVPMYMFATHCNTVEFAYMKYAIAVAFCRKLQLCHSINSSVQLLVFLACIQLDAKWRGIIPHVHLIEQISIINWLTDIPALASAIEGTSMVTGYRPHQFIPRWYARVEAFWEHFVLLLVTCWPCHCICMTQGSHTCRQTAGPATDISVWVAHMDTVCLYGS